MKENSSLYWQDQADMRGYNKCAVQWCLVSLIVNTMVISHKSEGGMGQ